MIFADGIPEFLSYLFFLAPPLQVRERNTAGEKE